MFICAHLYSPMHVCVHLCIAVYLCILVHTSVYIYSHLCPPVCTCAWLSSLVYTCLPMNAYAHLSIPIFTCVHSCTRVYTCAHLHIPVQLKPSVVNRVCDVSHMRILASWSHRNSNGYKSSYDVMLGDQSLQHPQAVRLHELGATRGLSKH